MTTDKEMDVFQMYGLHSSNQRKATAWYTPLLMKHVHSWKRHSQVAIVEVLYIYFKIQDNMLVQNLSNKMSIQKYVYNKIYWKNKVYSLV